MGRLRRDALVRQLLETGCNMVVWRCCGSAFEISEVSIGAPQGLVLGPTLFVIFINDIEEGICGNIFMFADDIKLFCKVGSDGKCVKLSADLRKLYNWSEDCQMLFNLDKCPIMHFGYNNENNIFLLGYHILETADGERDMVR